MVFQAPWNNYHGTISRVFQPAWNKYRPNTPCNLENHGKPWIFFQGFPDYMEYSDGIFSMLAGKPWKMFQGFSLFNIPWMPGITWKIVQRLPWSLNRKRNFWSKNNIHVLNEYNTHSLSKS